MGKHKRKLMELPGEAKIQVITDGIKKLKNINDLLKEEGSLEQLEKAFHSRKTAIFYLAWLYFNRDATKAYQYLFPQTNKATAGVLGHVLLKRISFTAVARAYGLNEDLYYKTLSEGIKATKTNIVYIGKGKKGKNLTRKYTIPDHLSRKPYHDKLGRILGIESDESFTGVSVKDGEKEIKVVFTRGTKDVA